MKTGDGSRNIESNVSELRKVNIKDPKPIRNKEQTESSPMAVLASVFAEPDNSNVSEEDTVVCVKNCSNTECLSPKTANGTSLKVK